MWCIGLCTSLCTTVAFDFSKDSKTRGNKHKLNQNHWKYNLRKHFFTNRIVARWNSLPGHVVDVSRPIYSVSIYLRIVWTIIGTCKILWFWVWINRNWKPQFRVITLTKVYTYTLLRCGYRGLKFATVRKALTWLVDLHLCGCEIRYTPLRLPESFWILFVL